jgi:capsular polysaccharide biosynthesis protein
MTIESAIGEQSTPPPAGARCLGRTLARGTESSDALTLTDVAEADVLPLRESLADFVEPTHRLGRLELLESRMWPAGRWHPDVVPAVPGGVAPDWWSPDPTIRCLPLNLYRVPDAFYVPSFGAVISSSGQVFRESVAQARYRTPDLDLLPGVAQDGEATYLTSTPDLPRLGEALVTMPWGAWYNYGHFVLDCLPGLAAAAELGELADYTPVFPPLRPWQLRHVELLGLERFTELEHPVYRVGDLLFPSSMQSFLHHPNVNYRTLRTRQLANVPKSDLSIPKLHLARAQGSRTFLSDQELSDAVEERGFVTVYPEQFPVEDQISLFYNARIIVGCAGAAFANVLYCRPGATIVEIIPMRMVETQMVSGVWVCNICAILGHRWRPFFTDQCWPDEGADETKPEVNFSFDLAIDDFVEYLEHVVAEQT